MKVNNIFDVFIIHYSILKNRYDSLSEKLSTKLFNQFWITENDVFTEKFFSVTSKSIMGVKTKLVGMDLGVNSRSLVFTRRRARVQGWILLLRSILQNKDSLIMGSMPKTDKLSASLLEVSCMHARAIRRGFNSNSEWILILEDDAIPESHFYESIKWVYCKFDARKKIWINLNSGAFLKHTKSDPRPDLMGFYRVKPALTRCSVAYMISKPLAREIIRQFDEYGIPDWLPVDIVMQVILRRSRALSFWQDPPAVIQGSESGAYDSNLRVN